MKRRPNLLIDGTREVKKEDEKGQSKTEDSPRESGKDFAVAKKTGKLKKKHI